MKFTIEETHGFVIVHTVGLHTEPTKYKEIILWCKDTFGSETDTHGWFYSIHKQTTQRFQYGEDDALHTMGESEYGYTLRLVMTGDHAILFKLRWVDV